MWIQTAKEVHWKEYDYVINGMDIITVEAWRPASMGTYHNPWEVNVIDWGSEYNIHPSGRYNKKEILQKVLDKASEKKPRSIIFRNIFK